MTSRDAAADRVWEQTLQEIRRTRARRKLRRSALATGATAALACAAVLFFTPDRPPEVQPPATVLHAPAPEAEVGKEMLVAVIWRNGQPVLEQLDPDELGYPDLQFSLEPVLAYSDARWDAF